jgi:hypothetical protein
LFLGFCNFY